MHCRKYRALNTVFVVENAMNKRSSFPFSTFLEKLSFSWNRMGNPRQHAVISEARDKKSYRFDRWERRKLKRKKELFATRAAFWESLPLKIYSYNIPLARGKQMSFMSCTFYRKPSFFRNFPCNRTREISWSNKVAIVLSFPEPCHWFWEQTVDNWLTSLIERWKSHVENRL